MPVNAGKASLRWPAVFFDWLSDKSACLAVVISGPGDYGLLFALAAPPEVLPLLVLFPDWASELPCAVIQSVVWFHHASIFEAESL